MEELKPGSPNFFRRILDFLRSDSVKFGLGGGVLAPCVGFLLYYKMMFSDHMTFKQYTRFLSSPDLLSKVISLSVIMNLLLFFYFIKQNRDLSAKGVLAATFIYASFIAYLKMFS